MCLHLTMCVDEYLCVGVCVGRWVWGWDSLINSQVFKQPKSCNLLLLVSEKIDIFSVTPGNQHGKVQLFRTFN